MMWNALEYGALFLIVLMHEFGHSLACRQVGGESNQILLWPLGGVAYVNPPQRPGATLWSIAAGPLVNVALLPILSGLWWLTRSWGWPMTAPDAYMLVRAVWVINCALLVFNLMPIYPLDGGQILRSLLWYWLGRARSLFVTSIVGFVGVAVLILVALAWKSVWLGIMAAFILMNCWTGLRQARLLARADQHPRHAGFACPSCHASPPVGAFWACEKCRIGFDTFETLGACPQCGEKFPVTRCLDCGALHAMREWLRPPPRLPGA